MKQTKKKTNIVGIQLWDFLRKGYALDNVKCFQLYIALLFLRRMDCLLEPYYKTIRNAFAHSIVDEDAVIEMTDGLTYYNSCGFSLTELISKQYDDYNTAFDNWISGFDIKTREVLKGLSLDNNISIINTGINSIQPLIVLLLDINLQNELSADEIREIFSLIDTRDFGQYRSPKSYSQCIAPFLFRFIDLKDEISIYDPVCGTTLMLQDFEIEADNLVAKDIECYGSELNHSVYSLSKALCVLTGKTYYHLDCVNSLTDGINNKHFDYIVADLPMGVKISPNEAKKIELINSHKDGISVSSVPETCFIQMIMNNLKRNGRAAVITPGLLLFDKLSDSFRSWLLNNNYVETIIRLPKNTPFDGVERYAWILAKNKSEELHDSIILADLQSVEGSVENLLANIDYLFDWKNWNNDLGEYFRICNQSNISKYNIHLVNRKTGKTAITNIPVMGEVDFVLRTQGFLTTDLGGDWDVLYNKTTKSYSISFQEFFRDNNVRYIDSDDLHSEVVSELSEVSSAISSIVSVDFPKRKVLKSPILSLWAGEFPSDWNPITLQEMFYCSPSYKGDNYIGSDKLPLLNVKYLRGEEDKVEYVVPTNKSVIVDDNDLIIIKTGANAGEVLKAKKGILGNTLFRMRFIDKASSYIYIDYARFVLMAMSDYFKTLNNGASIGFVKAEDINSSVAFIPSLDEQLRIVEFLKPICDNIERIEASLGTVIPKLEDYRNILIFDAVTGKLKI
ncbi:Type I restriction-modification system, DNA methylase subunit [Xylanibacter ruminicola]|uniref:site-specific DNA-methyltransferase (adenine-specific) n=1 Tax=Xylanibacter ruminicola TaxID=839 RepID=A0A1M7CT52_XYLRU|nr:N-6 DNA methylase [Xylanibacter ruminicola]SHL70406.1 Type I restriction-modification system, DNA methylase subunit [Xylanibacter ruminicola]